MVEGSNQPRGWGRRSLDSISSAWRKPGPGSAPRLTQSNRPSRDHASVGVLRSRRGSVGSWRRQQVHPGTSHLLPRSTPDSPVIWAQPSAPAPRYHMWITGPPALSNQPVGWELFLAVGMCRAWQHWLGLEQLGPWQSILSWWEFLPHPISKDFRGRRGLQVSDCKRQPSAARSRGGFSFQLLLFGPF